MGSGRRITLKNRMTFVIALFSTLIILSVMMAEGYSLFSYNRQIAETYGVLAERLGEDLNERMMDLEEYCRNITYTSAFYKSLLSSSPKSSFRLQSEHELMQMMKNKVTSTDRIHSLNVIDVREERIYSVMKTPDTDFMYELKRRVCKDSLKFDDSWTLYEYNDVTYCGRAFYNGRLVTAVFIDPRDFDLSGSSSSLTSEYAFLTYTYDDRFLINQEKVAQTGLTIEKTAEKNKLLSPYYVYDYEAKNSGVHAVLIIDRNEIINRNRILLILLLTGLVLELVLIYWMYRRMKQAVLDPVSRIVSKIEDIRSGRDAGEPEDVSDAAGQTRSPEEYRIIDDAIDELVRETGELKERYYQKVMEKEHAELQYYQLQTEPHFFLNCLKNINMLLELGEYEKAQQMILAFSSHIRYVFKDNAQTVSLYSEVAEAEAYFNICQLRTERTILLEKEIPEDLMGLQVPMLSVQAFVENSIKYAYQEGSALVIRITAARCADLPGMVRVSVTDNGPGYSEEALQKLNELEPGRFIPEKTGIHNLLNRMNIIYGGRASWRFYNTEEGGAAAELLIPSEDV